jgi:hypothetical protein
MLACSDRQCTHCDTRQLRRGLASAGPGYKALRASCVNTALQANLRIVCVRTASLINTKKIAVGTQDCAFHQPGVSHTSTYLAGAQTQESRRRQHHHAEASHHEADSYCCCCCRCRHCCCRCRQIPRLKAWEHSLLLQQTCRRCRCRHRCCHCCWPWRRLLHCCQVTVRLLPAV